MAIVMAIPVAVLLYFKMILNVLYSLQSSHKEGQRAELWRRLAMSLIAGPFIILLALLMDVIVIVGEVMKSEQSMV